MEFVKEHQTTIIVGIIVVVILLYLASMYIQNTIESSLLPIKKKLKKILPPSLNQTNQTIQNVPETVKTENKQEDLDTEIIEKSDGDADSYYDPTKL